LEGAAGAVIEVPFDGQQRICRDVTYHLGVIRIVDGMVFEFVDCFTVAGFSPRELLASATKEYETQVLIAEVGGEKRIVALHRTELEHTFGRREVSVLDGRGCLRLLLVQKRYSSRTRGCQYRGQYPVGVIRIS